MTTDKNLGNIIFLNGASSSGKTSIAKSLQQILDEPYLHMSVDTFYFTLSDWYGFEDSNEGYLKARTIDMTTSGFHHCISALSLSGNNVIVDHVLGNQEMLQECVDLLVDYPILFVGVRCPLEELERRELKRGDRQIGLAKRQFDIIHAHGTYDVEVDTSIYNPLECAIQIKEFLQEHDSLDAFKRLKQKYVSLKENCPPSNNVV